MRLTRCPVDLPLRTGLQLPLPDEAAAHLVRVLRLREGDACVLFNGDGRDYTATLVAVGKRDVQVRIDAATPVDTESPLAITLLQGVARGEKMDLILQKATELGVAAIVPVNAERTEVKLDAARTEKRIAHWRSVVGSACGQSGRARIPALSPPQALAAATAALPAQSLRLTLDPQGGHRLAGLPPAPAGGVVIAIGPEGGWSPRDRQQLADAGFQGLQLGPRILRTETAGLAAIAALQARLGDL
ncbi:16S rRNA (uracil(1498)-N(3))-methyltransferase [Stenotrophomonas mori]|uniref:Ribosomal RNA small subunit methyltransferase E n=1 Tax=Stenotrophomonas mori TaxID=2871096 RepID=A0ABT0SK52_9GAMM|nr:16S rRNA (uracil(1498)-N(3))-methyltransferase [Stenotrophomonas mori]MCL7715703.1 16S rRNA (uracil(1498)-N(3))-methyltransferase [Stenotrophomonas mori]